MNQWLGPEDLLDDELDQTDTTTPEVEPKLAGETGGWPDLPLGNSDENPEPELHREAKDASTGEWPLELAEERSSSSLGWWILLLVLLLPLGLYAGYRWNLDPPVLSVTQSWLDFGELRVGQSTGEKLLEISNTGERSLLLEAPSVSGESPEDFTVLDSTCPPELEPQAGCELRLQATPTADGLRKAAIMLTGNASNSPLEVALIVTGSQPRLNVEPTLLDFGQLLIGTRSQPLTARLTNSGDASLAIHTIDFEELSGGAADFVRQSDPCSQRQLQPGESCTLRFRFVPTQAGERSAALRINSDLTTNSPTVRLVGRAQEPLPKLAIDLTELDFGLWPVGEETDFQVVELQNDGRIPLRIQEILLPVESVFRADATECFTAPLEPQDSCRLSLSFAPTGTDAVAETLEIRHDGEGGLESIALSGAGSSPDFAVQPLRLSFGETPFREVSGQREIRFTNPGNARLILSRVAIGGVDAPAFTTQPGDCAVEILEPSTSCTMFVRFKPRRSGPHRAELIIRHNAANGSQKIALSGIGVRPRLEAPGEIDFGRVELGREERREMLLANRGRAPLVLRSIRLQGSRTNDFRLVAQNCLEQRVEPGESCRVEIFFQPDRLGSRDLQVKVESAQGFEEVRLKAVGVEPPKPEIHVQPSTLSFGKRILDAPALIETLVISNAGKARLALQSIEIEADHDDFSPASGSCDNQPFLETGKKCTFGIQFLPGAPGRRSARLLIRHNGENSPLVVELEGSGEASVSDALPESLPAEGGMIGN